MRRGHSEGAGRAVVGRGVKAPDGCSEGTTRWWVGGVWFVRRLSGSGAVVGGVERVVSG